MHIERLQVEAEGFLAGLDLRFSPGLNVIIGARGGRGGKPRLLNLSGSAPEQVRSLKKRKLKATNKL